MSRFLLAGLVLLHLVIISQQADGGGGRSLLERLAFAGLSPLQAAVASGMNAMGDVHGGAIEPCARILRDAVATGKTAEQVFSELRQKKQRLPGFGHPVHADDPRTAVLLALAGELGLTGPHTKLAQELEKQSLST